MIRFAYIIVLVCFWLSRSQYWNGTFELPFSDMSEFEAVARNIINHFNFGLSEFWFTYKSPTLPSLRAIQITLFGDTLLAWRIFQAAICFLSLCFLAREIFLSSKSHFLTISILLAVVFAKSSVFWSLKLATEGTAEGLLYLTTALSFYTVRKKSLTVFFITGVVFAVSLLNRPNYLLSIVIFPLVLMFLTYTGRWKLNGARPWKSLGAAFLVYSLGVSVIWAPWIFRSYRIYGEIIPLNTSGHSTFIYGVWNIEITDQHGKWVTKNWDEIMQQATVRFSNDLEFHKWCGTAVSRWWKYNWKSFPGLYLARVNQAIIDRDVQLTKVSRLNLFPEPLNTFFYDKNKLLIISGIIGLFVLPFVYGSSIALIGLLSVPAWMFALLFQGNPRFLEPLIPLFSWGNIGWISLLVSGLLKRTTFVSKAQNLLAIFVLTLGVSYVITAIVSAPEIQPPEKLKLVNPGMERYDSVNQGLRGWELGGIGQGAVNYNVYEAFKGKASAEIIVEKDEKAFYQDLEDPRLVAGKEFKVSAWVKASAHHTIRIAVSDGKKWFHSLPNKKANEWERIEIRGVASDECTGFRLHFYVKPGRALLDNVSLELCGTDCQSNAYITERKKEAR